MGTYHERSDEPFPSFHLCDLSSFTLADPSTLTSAQLALGALFFPDEAGCTLKQQAVRTWRRRREQGRARVGGKIGVFASAEERARERWPLFECIDLAFKVDNPLELLSSAQLVALQFHPEATKELLRTAEDIWFARRERAAAAGFTLETHSSETLEHTSSTPPLSTWTRHDNGLE